MSIGHNRYNMWVRWSDKSKGQSTDIQTLVLNNIYPQINNEVATKLIGFAFFKLLTIFLLSQFFFQ